MNRRTLAFAVIALWVGGLVIFARHQSVQSPLDRLLQASLKIAPETYYYSVELNGAPIGAAMSSVDTAEKRILTNDLFTGRYPVGKDTLSITARARSAYSRALLLKNFMFQVEGTQIGLVLSGRVVGDSMLYLVTQSLGDTIIRTRQHLRSPAFMPTFAPIVGFLTKDRNAGDTVHVSVFDPLSRQLKLITIQVHEDSLFTIADSAELDPIRNEWHVAGTDTVRARRLDGDGDRITLWVDKEGRIVSAHEAGGLQIMRTAYEIAFRRKKH